jgi:hypothetical protein
LLLLAFPVFCHSHQLAWVFNAPVDTSTFTDYKQHVSQPMDFGTMMDKVEKKQYNEPAEVGVGVGVGRGVWGVGP